jgi:hypothetical protein
LERLLTIIAFIPWLTKGWQVYFVRLFTFLFGILGEAREMGKSGIATTGAIAYERLPLIVALLSETEVAHPIVRD